MENPAVPTRERAETIAIAALTFLAKDLDRLGRFVALTGLGPEALKLNATRPEFQAGVLEYLMTDESLLLVFAAESGLEPTAIRAAAQALLEASEAQGGCGHGQRAE